MTWYSERLHLDSGLGYAQGFEVTRVVCERTSEFQKLLVFETPAFGRVLVLDGVVQTTERDEFIYHEMMAHVPILAHGRVARVLIIGGGDGGVLREVLRHRAVAGATLVDIDRAVVEVSREHMPSLSAGAFEDKRAEVLIADGIKFVAETDRAFDVIIVDSTDPVGPGESLFTQDFYAACKRRLTPGGVLVTQNGVPFFQPGELAKTRRLLAPLFADASFYAIAVPSYVGGMMTLAWATDDAGLRSVAEATLAGRYAAAGLATRYYTPAVHRAAFALPPFIAQLAG